MPSSAKKSGSKKGSAKSAKKSSAKPKPSAARERPPAKRKPRSTKRRASRAASPKDRGAKGRPLSFLNLGRPSIIAPDLIEAICNNLADGLSFENACVFAGIADSTGRDWLRRARVALIRIDDERQRLAKERGVEPAEVPDDEVPPLESEQIFIEFSAAVKRAQAWFQIENLRMVKSGVERWQANAWLLERRNQDEFALQRGSKEAAPVAPKGNQPADRVVGRYTEIYVGTETVPLPTPEQVKASHTARDEDEED
jgi:hypothetical protein